jgi:hypothetical protein
VSSDGRRRRLPNAQMRPDNTGIKSGYLQNNFRIDKNGQRIPECPEASQAGYKYAMEPEASEGVSFCRARLGED